MKTIWIALLGTAVLSGTLAAPVFADPGYTGKSGVEFYGGKPGGFAPGPAFADPGNSGTWASLPVGPRPCPPHPTTRPLLIPAAAASRVLTLTEANRAAAFRVRPCPLHRLLPISTSRRSELRGREKSRPSFLRSPIRNSPTHAASRERSCWFTLIARAALSVPPPKERVSPEISPFAR